MSSALAARPECRHLPVRSGHARANRWPGPVCPEQRYGALWRARVPPRCRAGRTQAPLGRPSRRAVGLEDLTSVALGIAEAEGRLALDDPALKYYPELAGSAASRLDQVTLRHLLMMTSGSPYSWSAYDPVVVPDLAADFFATPLAHEPGTYFRYTGIGPYVAARALRAATGANVRDYLMPRLFTPLAIHNPQWHTCPSATR